MNISISQHITLTMKYVFPRGKTSYWQRVIPLDVRDRYPHGRNVKVNLHTQDPRVIASKVAKLNKEHEALWDAMRRDPSLTPSSVKEEARKLLAVHGVSERKSDEMAVSLFFDKLDEKRERYASRHEDPEEAYHSATLEDFLTKPEAEAVKLVQSSGLVLISDALELYLREHQKRGQARFDKLETYTRRIIAKLVKVLGDKVLAEVSREDAYTFRDYLLGSLKTDSVKRNINVVKAVFAKGISEKSLNIPNVWLKLSIQGLGTDAEKRESFTPDELAKVKELCLAKDDEIRWLLAMLVDTGARLGEVVGLAVEDIHIRGEAIPYLDIKPHTWRPLKTAESTRKVPLVGVSLWGASRLLEHVSKGQPYAFPRYIKDGNCETNSPSATLNKFMDKAGLPHTCHELRHTMRDRLRNTGATKDIQDAVGNE